MKDIKPHVWIGVIIITLLLLAFIGSYRSFFPARNEKLQVVTSFYPLYFFASQIGGNRAEVFNITPAGAEPHDYDPKPQDIAKIENSSVIVLNGGVEMWTRKIQDDLKDKPVILVIAGDGLITQNDPHVWLNPQLAKQEAAAIAHGFEKADPANTSYYDDREKNLDLALDQLHTDYLQGLKDCKKKDIVTSHAAFGYLAQQYGLNQVSITGLSPDEEPTAQKLAEVADFVKKNNVSYIFFESLVSPRFSQAIAQETGAQTLALDPLEGIPEAEMKTGTNYLTIMRRNLTNLRIALECK